MPDPLPANPFSAFVPNTTRWNACNARALVYAANLAYEPVPANITAKAATWGFDPARVTVIAPASSVLQAVVLGGTDKVVLAFRGTRPDQLTDWMADFEIEKVSFSDYFPSPDVGMVHEGFCRLLAGSWPEIQAAVSRYQDNGQPLWITGHSLGGALATLATAAYTFAAREPVNGLYTFGQPRVGDLAFCTQSETHFGDIMFRFVNDEDIVTRVPPRIVPGIPLPSYYGHTGQLRFFEANGALHSDDHWWNAFLLEVEVGFANMKAMLAAPVADHCLDCVPAGYLGRIEQYLNAGQYPL